MNILKDNNILLVKVLPNSESLLTFDLKNGKSKTVMLKRFCEWYSFEQILHCLKNGSKVGGIKVDVKLTFIKLLQIVWLSDFCNYIKSSKIIRNGCLRSGAADVIKIGSTLLPFLDYFRDIDYSVQMRKFV